jgi:hypothetical protein
MFRQRLPSRRDILIIPYEEIIRLLGPTRSRAAKEV